MVMIQAINITKAFGVETIFRNLQLELHKGDRIGLIGANGAGKSTLMRCLLGLEPLDDGQVQIGEGITVGYVEQDSDFSDGTLHNFLLSAWHDVLNLQTEMAELEQAIAAGDDSGRQQILLKRYGQAREKFERSGGYEYENLIRRVTAGLGFGSDDLDRPLREFSGGQKTRISLAKALARKPDFLFLDEPTNHLDIGMVEWLEEYLASYSGGLLIISHDRYFLDRVTTGIVELEFQQLKQYKGNYSRFVIQKAEQAAAHAAAFEKQQEYIEKTEAYINRFRAGIKSKQARGRQSQLNRLERLAAPMQQESLDFTFGDVSDCAERVAEMEKVTAAYGNNQVFAGLSLLIRKREGVALVGPNGAGKTTLLKVLTGELKPQAGRVKLGNRVKQAYFSQEHENLCLDNIVLKEIVFDFGLSEERARTLLGSFLFTGDDVYKTIATLSGGEKARLALLKLMMTGANFLILDEPTNHLDIPAKEAVEEAILAFPGTFLTVSHDRYFLDKVAERVIELADGKLSDYTGNYSYYREKKKDIEKKEAAASSKEPSNTKEADQPAPPRSRRTDNTRLIEKLEIEITEQEIMVKVHERQLNDPANHTDIATSKALADQYEEAKGNLSRLYDKWLELTADD